MTKVTEPSDIHWSDWLRPGMLIPAALVIVGTWLTAVDSLMTVTMMPTIASEIGGYGWLGWAVAAFSLGSILAGATSGWLSERLGLRNAMMMCGGVYALGCFAGACAPGVLIFMLARGLQGIGGGWVMGLCYVAVTTLFPERMWPRILSALAGVWGVATLASPLIGGLFAEAGQWRWGFGAFAGQGLAFGLAVFLLVPATIRPDRPPPSIPAAPLVALGLAIIALGAAGVITGLAVPLLLGILGTTLLALFVTLEAGPHGGLLPHRATRWMTAEGSGLIAVFCFTSATVSFTVYGPALMQALHGASPTSAGYAIVSEAVGWTLTALAVSGRPPKQQGLWIRIGAGLIALGLILLSIAVPYGSLPLVALCAAIQGAGFGSMWAFVSGRIVGAAPEIERAIASASIPTTQLIGNALGAAMAALIANSLGLASAAQARGPVPGAEWIFLAFLPQVVIGIAAAWHIASPRFLRNL